MLFNLAFPWLVLAAASALLPSAKDPNFWMLQGLQDHLSIYGIPAYTSKWGVLGIFLPLAILHNVTYLFVRLVQARIDLDFLPMIRSVLGWVGVGILCYWLWISFNRGATFGEFHHLVLAMLPVLGLCIGLAFFVGRNKSQGSAQLTALVVAWAPLYSIVATLAGNHLRPPHLFKELSFEPGGGVKGWAELDEKTRSRGYLRLTVDKEGVPVQFPALARHLKIEFAADKKTSRMEAELDPIATAQILLLPEQIEVAGWRPMAANQKLLSEYCLAVATAKGQAPLVELSWVKADAILSIHVNHCADTAKWTMSSHTSVFSLGGVDKVRAAQLKERREATPTPIAEVDQTLLTAADWRQRKLGFGLLSQVNDPSIIPLLAHGFYDRDVEVRQTAATGLLSWGAKSDEFLTKALSDPDAFMRGDALRIVALSNRFKPHPAAFRMLTDPSDYVRVAAVQALEPFVMDTFTLKTLMQAFDREYAKANPSPDSRDHLKKPVIAELVVVIAHAQDVRTAATLLKALPINLTAESNVKGRPEFEAAQSLRAMKNWMGVDYLQAIVKRSATLENREKALSIMALWREPGDEDAYIKALKDPALRPHAISLEKDFKSAAVTDAINKLAEPEIKAR